MAAVNREALRLRRFINPTAGYGPTVHRAKVGSDLTLCGYPVAPMIQSAKAFRGGTYQYGCRLLSIDRGNRVVCGGSEAW